MTETISVTGFNGEYQDGVLHQYILGNGYRAYNPTLQRFTCPDSLSPFGKGGINPYAYCAGDPINNTDPTGHFIVALLASIILPVVAGAAVDAAVGAVVEGGAIAAGVAAGAAEAGGAAEAAGAEAVEAVGNAAARDALGGNAARDVARDLGIDGERAGTSRVVPRARNLKRTMPRGSDETESQAGKRVRQAFRDAETAPMARRLEALRPDSARPQPTTGANDTLPATEGSSSIVDDARQNGYLLRYAHRNGFPVDVVTDGNAVVTHDVTVMVPVARAMGALERYRYADPTVGKVMGNDTALHGTVWDRWSFAQPGFAPRIPGGYTRAFVDTSVEPGSSYAGYIILGRRRPT